MVDFNRHRKEADWYVSDKTVSYKKRSQNVFLLCRYL